LHFIKKKIRKQAAIITACLFSVCIGPNVTHMNLESKQNASISHLYFFEIQACESFVEPI